METDLVRIRGLAEAQQAENVAFRRYLRLHPSPDRAIHEIAERVTRQIDCTSCANCCRQTRINVSEGEIDVIASHLATPTATVKRLYTEIDRADRRRILRQENDSCVFLDGNLCMIYAARPRGCREFPYLVTATHGVGARMSSICGRAWMCPIVFNTLEEYKKLAGYRR